MAWRDVIKLIQYQAVSVTSQCRLHSVGLVSFTSAWLPGGSWQKKLEKYPHHLVSTVHNGINLYTMVPPPTTRYRSKPSFTSFSETPTLITAKTSEPVSPTNSEKRVCFADSIGLSLASIRFISPCRSDRKLKLLRQRYRDGRNVFVPQSNTGVRYLSCDFAQPIDTALDFEDRLNTQHVCLERLLSSNSALLGTVKVKNLAFEKKVTVRVSFDCWETYRDIWADYVSAYPDNEADKFIFRITLPSYFAAGQKIEFAIRYIVGEEEFWDNNFTKNYSVSCLKVEKTNYSTVPEFDQLPALLEL